LDLSPQELREKFEIVATSVDRRNQSFVSLMQGSDLANKKTWHFETLMEL